MILTNVFTQPSMRHLGFCLILDMMDGGGNRSSILILADGVGLRTVKSELKNMAGVAAIVGLDSCDVVVKNRLLITCTLVSGKGDTRPSL